MVFVIRVMQMHKIQDADFFLVVGEVVDKMMEKCAHFEECLHSLSCWRTGRQNLEGKENRQIFIHRTGKGSLLGVCLLFFSQFYEHSLVVALK